MNQQFSIVSLNIFKVIEDPRQSAKLRYQLNEIILVA